MNTEISSFAKLMPGHILGPLPNPRKLKGFNGACRVQFNSKLYAFINSAGVRTETQFLPLINTSNLDGSNL